MKRLAIIGSGELGRQIAFYAEEDNHYQVVGFFDDYELPGSVRHGVPILGKVTDSVEAYKKNQFDFLMIGIGYKHFDVRSKLYEQLSVQIPFGRIIHSSSFVNSGCLIGKGVFIYPGCVLDMEVEIGNNVLINVGCVIAHNSKIGDHSFLSPGINIAGFVKLGACINLGIGTIVIDNISIKSGIRTGAGAVVTENLTVPGLYVGIPAKFKKTYDSIQ